MEQVSVKPTAELRNKLGNLVVCFERDLVNIYNFTVRQVVEMNIQISDCEEFEVGQEIIVFNYSYSAYLELSQSRRIEILRLQSNYQIVARELIFGGVHPDGYSNVMHELGEEIEMLKLDLREKKERFNELRIFAKAFVSKVMQIGPGTLSNEEVKALLGTTDLEDDENSAIMKDLYDSLFGS